MKPAFEELQEFFLYLQEQGFPCGVGERYRAMELCARLPERYCEERLKTVLAPVFARNPPSQQRFYEAFDLYFAPTEPEEPPPVRSGEEPLSAPPQPKPPVRYKGLRKYFWWGVATALVATAFWLGDALGLIRAATQRLQELPGGQTSGRLRPHPDGPGVSYRQTLNRVDQWYEHSCGGWECVAGPWRPWVLASPLLLLAFYYILRQTSGWRRRTIIRRERQRGPPFEWPVFRAEPQMRTFQELIERTAESMRLRLTGETDEIDIAATVHATVQAAGFPTIRMQTAPKAMQFLFLVQQLAPEDHFARWWRSVAARLRARGALVDCFSYRSDLRRVYERSGGPAMDTTRLLDQCASHSVMVFGDARALMHPVKAQWASWGATVVSRESRALLTPEASFEWTASNRMAGSRLPVFAARLRQLRRAAAMLASIAAPSPSRTAEDGAEELPTVPETFLDETETEGLSPGLRMFLDDDVFEWLCACAIYPRMEWELTLHVAMAVDPSGGILSERKLMQLIRLPWFREGRIPDPWRKWLVRCLSPPPKERALRMLIGALNRNRAPRLSWARDQQDLQIAAMQYWLEPGNPSRRAELQMLFDSMPESDAGQDPVVGELRDAWKRERGRPSSPQQLGLALRRFRHAYLGPAVLGGGILVAIAGVLLDVPVKAKHTVEVPSYEAVVAKTGSASQPGLPKQGPPRSQPSNRPPLVQTMLTISVSVGGKPAQQQQQQQQQQQTLTPEQIQQGLGTDPLGAEKIRLSSVTSIVPRPITDLDKPGDVYQAQAEYAIRSACATVTGRVPANLFSGTFADAGLGDATDLAKFGAAMAALPMLEIYDPPLLSLEIRDDEYASTFARSSAIPPKSKVRVYADSLASTIRKAVQDPKIQQLIEAQLTTATSVLENSYADKDPRMEGVSREMPALTAELSALRQVLAGLSKAYTGDPAFADVSDHVNKALFGAQSWPRTGSRMGTLDNLLAYLSGISDDLQNLEAKLPAAEAASVDQLRLACANYFGRFQPIYQSIEASYPTDYAPRANQQTSATRAKLYRALGLPPQASK